MTAFSNTALPMGARPCPQCGKPEHGSIACECAAGWPSPGPPVILSRVGCPLCPGKDAEIATLQAAVSRLEGENQELHLDLADVLKKRELAEGQLADCAKTCGGLEYRLAQAEADKLAMADLLDAPSAQRPAIVSRFQNLRAEQAEAALATMTAEREANHCRDCCCAQSWAALGVTKYDRASIPEHILALKQRADELEAALREVHSRYILGGAMLPFGHSYHKWFADLLQRAQGRGSNG